VNTTAKRVVLLFCVIASTVGCMLPVYRLPAGYSSSYRDRLSPQPVTTMEGLSPAAVRSDGTAHPAANSADDRRGFFLPSTIRVSPNSF